MSKTGKAHWILVIFCLTIFLIIFSFQILKVVPVKKLNEKLKNENTPFIANAHTDENDDKKKRKLKYKHLSYNDSYKELEIYLERSYTEDQELRGFLHKYWFAPPSFRTYIQEENKDKYKGQAGQAFAVDQILKGKTNGVFIESGAADGVSSNTIFFEKFRNWTGVLVEPIPKMYNKLLALKRNAWHINACLSSNNKMEKINFANFEALSGNLDSLAQWNSDLMKKYKVQSITVQCFPFHTVIAALNFTVIDYFSLDVEGAEMQVLKTIDFSRVSIRVFSIEYRDGVNTLTKLNELRIFFKKLGYMEWGIVTEREWTTGLPKDEEGLDVIFYKL